MNEAKRNGRWVNKSSVDGKRVSEREKKNIKFIAQQTIEWGDLLIKLSIFTDSPRV